MGYERYSRDSNLGDYYNRSNDEDFGRDYGTGREFGYSSARQYRAGGDLDSRDRDYGPREYGYGRYAQRDRFPESRDRAGYGAPRYDRGGYVGDRHRFTDMARRDDEDRGFFERAGDEVRSWFGDEEAERRRERDARRDQYGYGRDDDYHGWRRSQIEALDRDYDEYRRENRARFENEFGTWRNERRSQRGALGRVTGHMEVVGADGAHVGTVDKVRGDRIVLTKSDNDAGGRHHSIPSRWIKSVDDKVTIARTADEAHTHWRDEERNQALFGDDSRGEERDVGASHNLNRSFSGTY
ncbi:MAG: DUF2171 domain-containing protein [Pseudomonadota bacterium]